MSVELEPSELGFRRPFTHEVAQVLTLRNPNQSPVAFKVKTTAPKQYCVRPNSGRIDPGSQVDVSVLLQSMKEDPPLDARCRDKFLVQSIAITPDQDTGNVTSIWANMERISRDAIKERKIRVVFLPAHDPSYTPSHSNVNGSQIPEEAPPAYRSPSPAYGSPPHNAASPSNNETPVKESKGSKDGVMGTENNTATSTIAAAASATGHTMQEQLDATKEKIVSLHAQLEEQGLRQRKSDAVAQDSRERITTGTTGMGVQTQPAEGVPVQIVAALCLLSFLLAYFFF